MEDEKQKYEYMKIIFKIIAKMSETKREQILQAAEELKQNKETKDVLNR